MSRGFVKEYEDQWLHEIAPTMNALMRFLTMENNGVRIYEKNTMPEPKTGRKIHAMSNGLWYALNDTQQWYVVEITEP
jgi:hypothetical protein